jgi:hypothetical protein
MTIERVEMIKAVIKINVDGFEIFADDEDDLKKIEAAIQKRDATYHAQVEDIIEKWHTAYKNAKSENAKLETAFLDLLRLITSTPAVHATIIGAGLTEQVVDIAMKGVGSAAFSVFAVNGTFENNKETK